MKANASLRRWLAAGITMAVIGLLVFIVEPGRSPNSAEQQTHAADVAARVWPLFGGTLQRNMVNTWEKNLPGDCKLEWKTITKKNPENPKEEIEEKVIDLPKCKNVKWVATLGSRAYGGPVIAGGKVFVGTNNEAPRNPKITGDKGILMCFRESDGEFLWQAVHDKLPSGQVHDWPTEGLCATPAVEGDRVYYTSNRCEVVCADINGNPATKEAKIIWKLEMMKELNVFPHNMTACSPLVAGDTVFVVTANGVDEGHINIPSPQAPSFIAVDKNTGKVKWKSNAPGKNIMHGQWSNPTYAVVNGKPQVIFPGGDGWLHSFEPETGKPIWTFDANPKDAVYKLGGAGTKSDFIATPVVVENKLYIGTGQDPEHYTGVGHLWCIDITRTGDVSPDLVEDAKANPVKTKKNPNSAVVWHYGGAVPKDQQKKLMIDYYFGRTMSTCAVHDGLVYAGEIAGYLHCLDAKTGEHYWAHDLKSAIWGSAYWVDGKVYIGTEDGDLWVFPHGKQKPQPKKMEFPEALRSTPVAVNGVLYVMTEARLYAVANK